MLRACRLVSATWGAEIEVPVVADRHVAIYHL